MCSMYWTLRHEVALPCGHLTDDWQTHFMGESGSCSNWYRLGAIVEELGSYTGSLPGDEWFISDYRTCDTFYSLSAEIKSGRVVRVGIPVPTTA